MLYKIFMPLYFRLKWHNVHIYIIPQITTEKNIHSENLIFMCKSWFLFFMTMQVSNDIQTNEFILFICKCLFFITKSCALLSKLTEHVTQRPFFSIQFWTPLPIMPYIGYYWACSTCHQSLNLFIDSTYKHHNHFAHILTIFTFAYLNFKWFLLDFQMFFPDFLSTILIL